MGRVIGHLMYRAEDVREHVREALAVVDECDPPEDLRVAVFTGALNLLSNKLPELVQDRELQVIPEHMLRR